MISENIKKHFTDLNKENSKSESESELIKVQILGLNLGIMLCSMISGNTKTADQGLYKLSIECKFKQYIGRMVLHVDYSFSLQPKTRHVGI